MNDEFYFEPACFCVAIATNEKYKNNQYLFIKKIIMENNQSELKEAIKLAADLKERWHLLRGRIAA